MSIAKQLDKYVVINQVTGEVLPFRMPMSRYPEKTVPEGESMTHQSHFESCDINRIVSRFQVYGELPVVKGNPQYGDVTNLQAKTLTEHIETARQVQEKVNEYAKAKAKAKAAPAGSGALTGAAGSGTPAPQEAPQATQTSG